MEHVSSFLESILTIETDEGAVAAEKSQEQIVTDLPELVATSEKSPKKEAPEAPEMTPRTSMDSTNSRRFSEIDFTSFFMPAKATDTDESSKKGAPSSGSIITDKLFEKFLSVVAPLDESDVELTRVLTERIENQKLRPPLSYNVMSKNATQLNARLSSTFIVFDNIYSFFNWTNPLFTIGVQVLATHCVLNPYLLTVIPCVLILGNFLIPSYLHIYPPDCSFGGYLDTNPIPSYNKLEKFKLPHPVNQFSREFYVNMTDLQNHQTLFVTVWDFMVWLTTDYLYFKNETLSTVVYLGLLLLIPMNLLLLPLVIPFLLARMYIIKAFVIGQIWLIPILLHPQIRGIILESICKEETRLNSQNAINKIELYLCSFIVRPEDKYQIKDIEDFDVKEVEIFELQKFDPETKIWTLHGFSNTIYSINNSIRRVNTELKKQDIPEEEKPYYRFNEKLTIDEILPPLNWKFLDDKWNLDLNVNEWVDDNLIFDLVSIDEDEKWVYDYTNEGDDEKPIVYRRRRWIRNCRRETYQDKLETKPIVTGWEFT